MKKEGMEFVRMRNVFGAKVRTPIKIIFWESIFKGLATGLIIGTHNFVRLFQPDLAIPYRHQTMVTITKQIARRNKWGLIARWRLNKLAEILAAFLSVDGAYARFIEQFIVDYYEKHYHFNLKEKKK